MRMIDADALYEQLQKDEELARKRVLDTESYLPYPNNLNPSYTRYVAQMDERTRLKHIVADAHTIEPEIIRCCECKYLQCNMRPDGYLPKGVDEFECRHWCGSCDPMDFCSYAERREVTT